MRSRDMWKEMVQIQAVTGLPTLTHYDRTRRQTNTYDAQPAHYAATGSAPGTGGTPMSGSCCTCQVSAQIRKSLFKRNVKVGPPGPPGSLRNVAHGLEAQK